MCRSRPVTRGKRLLNERLEIFRNEILTCYNDTIMTGKMQIGWLLHIVVGVTLLSGLIPMPSMMSMQVGHMTMPAGAGAFYEIASTWQNAPSPCCSDAIGSLSITCGILLPHFACATHSVGTQRVTFSPFFIQISHREIVTPPPKI